MVMCWAIGCYHYSEKNDCHFYKFPTHPTERKKLEQQIRRNIASTQNSRICSCHFVDGIFEHNEEARSMKNNNLLSEETPRPKPSLSRESRKLLEPIDLKDKQNLANKMTKGSNCSVVICKNSSKKAKENSEEIRFFTFPKDPKIRKQWVTNCHGNHKFNLNSARVCSKHFTSEDFEDKLKAELLGYLPKILKKSAVPTLDVLTTSCDDAQQVKKRISNRYFKDKERKQLVEELLNQSSCEPEPQENLETFQEQNKPDLGLWEQEKKKVPKSPSTNVANESCSLEKLCKQLKMSKVRNKRLFKINKAYKTKNEILEENLINYDRKYGCLELLQDLNNPDAEAKKNGQIIDNTDNVSATTKNDEINYKALYLEQVKECARHKQKLNKLRELLKDDICKETDELQEDDTEEVSMQSNFNQDVELKEEVKNENKGDSGSSRLLDTSPVAKPKSDEVGHVWVKRLIKVRCIYCEFMTPNVSIYASHIKNEHRNSNSTDSGTDKQLYRCQFCDFIDSNKRELVKHWKEVHCMRYSKRLTQCRFCSFSSTVARVARHIAYNHITDRPFACDQCEYKGKNKQSLKEHKKLHLGGVLKRFRCHLCPGTFQSLTAINTHFANVHNVSSIKPSLGYESFKGQPKRFTCEICEKSYSSQPVLEKHMKEIHDPDKKHVCHYCGFSTNYKRHLNMHINIEHRDHEAELEVEVERGSPEHIFHEDFGELSTSTRPIKKIKH